MRETAIHLSTNESLCVCLDCAAIDIPATVTVFGVAMPVERWYNDDDGQLVLVAPGGFHVYHALQSRKVNLRKYTNPWNPGPLRGYGMPRFESIPDDQMQIVWDLQDALMDNDLNVLHAVIAGI